MCIDLLKGDPYRARQRKNETFEKKFLKIGEEKNGEESVYKIKYLRTFSP